MEREQQVQRPRGKLLTGINLSPAKSLSLTGMRNAGKGGGMRRCWRDEQGTQIRSPKGF